MIFSSLRAKSRFQNAYADSHSIFWIVFLLCLRAHARPRACARERARAIREKKKEQRIWKKK